MEPCKACGACENHVRCDCCGFCRNCGLYVALPPAWPYIYPIYPAQPWQPYIAPWWLNTAPSWTITCGTYSNIPNGQTVGHTFIGNSLENVSFTTSPDATGYSGEGQ